MASPTDKSGELAAQGVHDWIAAHYGPAVATIADFGLYALGAVFAALICVFLGLLRQGDSGKEHERAGYLEWRAKFAAGGWFTEVYARNLTGALNWLDRFLGDHDKADLTAFPHFLGLGRKSGKTYPLWTGAAYDRCLLLALVYPISCILVFWATSGEQGPAETALGLDRGVETWRRWALFGGFAAMVLSWWQIERIDTWHRWLWLLLPMVAVVGAVHFSLVGAFDFPFGAAILGVLAVAIASVRAGPHSGAGACAVAVAVALATATGFENSNVSRLGLYAGGGVFSAIALLVSELAVRFRRQGLFLTLFTLLFICVLLAIPAHAFLAQEWQYLGVRLLFICLLTLINAPFDWAAIGLTRALLRRGVEAGGWAPVRLALVDIASAFVLVALLAGAMVIGVQAFDYLSVDIARAQRILSVRDTLAQLSAAPWEPKFWWIYATLFSTFIPSVFNLALAGVSLTRGVPPVSRWIAGKMPEAHAPSWFDASWLAFFMAAQTMLGILLAVAAIGALGWLMFHEAPIIGQSFLAYAQWVESLEIPRRVNEWALGVLGR